ncbi:phosphomannomutase/phosphoglucomutase [Patescibacteria group bacterium]|nr:phosphomannomutase/phosphoglucomutase [Patescibacteria group bacterium]
MYSFSSFKAYDIRGIYGKEIDEELAYLVGKALPNFLNANTIAIGSDARTSSPSLKNSLIKGINESGASVLDLGLVTTPMLNFAIVNNNLNCGVMVSASHNPPEYNALKIVASDALQLSRSSGLLDIKKIIEQKAFVKINSEVVENKSLNILDDYLKHILSNFSIKNKVKVIADFGNGMGAISAIPCYLKIEQLDAKYLYKEIDCTFPNHMTDPDKLENMQKIMEEVKTNKVDLGIFFDGDADRCYFIDETGEVVLADIAFCLLVEEELKKETKFSKQVYYDLRFSKEIKNVIEKNGGTPVMMRVGNPFYKEKMNKEGGLVASEFSGHIMYAQNFGIDDGLFASLKMIEILSNYQKPLSTLIQKYKTYFSEPEIIIKIDKKNIDLIFKKLREKYYDGEEIILDGLYIQYPSWWFNIRKSNTEAVVRLRIEAETRETLHLQKNEILNIINS